MRRDARKRSVEGPKRAGNPGSTIKKQMLEKTTNRRAKVVSGMRTVCDSRARLSSNTLSPSRPGEPWKEVSRDMAASVTEANNNTTRTSPALKAEPTKLKLDRVRQRERFFY